MPDKTLKKFLKQQSVVPFETMFAFYSLYSGVAGLLSFGITNDIFRNTLGIVASGIFNIGYIIAGAMMYWGIGTRKGNIEAAGIIAIVTSVLIRMVVVVIAVGFNAQIFNLYVFSLAFIVACIVRLTYIINGETILTLKEVVEMSKVSK